MIEGLKLTMTGEELRKRLDERVKHHERIVEQTKRGRRGRSTAPTRLTPCGVRDSICELWLTSRCASWMNASRAR
jgi:hypothetical protein